MMPRVNIKTLYCRINNLCNGSSQEEKNTSSLNGEKVNWLTSTQTQQLRDNEQVKENKNFQGSMPPL